MVPAFDDPPLGGAEGGGYGSDDSDGDDSARVEMGFGRRGAAEGAKEKIPGGSV
jgi:hypothetical protein